MNSTMKTVLLNSKLNCSLYVRGALFHSTPVLDRKRRNSYWESSSRNHNYSKRSRRIHSKQTLLRNVNDYADYLFQKWQNPDDLNEPSSSRGTSWFKKQYSANGSKKKWRGNQGPSSWGRRDFDFCEDYVDVETNFQSRFGSSGFFYWSFVNEDDSQWRRSSNYSGKSWSWRHRKEEKFEYDSDNSESDERLALGLSAVGPLKLEDVKNAYRSCALKWHPDRHQGSSKAAAEEKFKHCSSAYQSLCDKLAMN
ncbi:uncharacterized protein LOC126800029 isoform X1 [Argentina anserina]|uniref:uncharacterized protein LOC126800029 isoform X1 n=1 Tax=Argentina anserina TaxID=57926 RepID=UPI0021763C3B|nr:uncharacterized protein LOC126800029 isoform X1 [Potentilla anserina]